MPTEAKAVTIDELSVQLQQSSLVVLTDYRGLSVTDLQSLRATLRPNGQFRIAKNTLTRIAAERAGIEGLDPLLEGPLALGFADGDMVAFAKALVDFQRTSRVLTVRGGVMEGRVVDSAAIEALSTMPSKEELQSKFLGLLQAPARNVVTVLSAPSRSLAYVMQARADQLGGGEAMAAD